MTGAQGNMDPQVFFTFFFILFCVFHIGLVNMYLLMTEMEKVFL